MQNGPQNGKCSLDNIVSNPILLDSKIYNLLKEKLTSSRIIPLYYAGYKNYAININILDSLKGDEFRDLRTVKGLLYDHSNLIKNNKIEENRSAVKLTYDDYITFNKASGDIFHLISKPTNQGLLGRLLSKGADNTSTFMMPTGTMESLDIINGTRFSGCKSPEDALEYLRKIDHEIKKSIIDLPDDPIKRAQIYLNIFKSKKPLLIKDNRYGNVKREIEPKFAFKKLEEYANEIVLFANNKHEQLDKANSLEIRTMYNLAKFINDSKVLEDPHLNLDVDISLLEAKYQRKILTEKQEEEKRKREELILKELKTEVTYKLVNNILDHMKGYIEAASNKASFMEFKDMPSTLKSLKDLGLIKPDELKSELEKAVLNVGFEDPGFALGKLLERIKHNAESSKGDEFTIKIYKQLGLELASLITNSSKN